VVKCSISAFPAKERRERVKLVPHSEGGRLTCGSESDDALLREIRSKAATLYERIDLFPRSALAGPDSCCLADNRLSRWKHVAANNSNLLFARRLEWDGLDPAEARSLLATAATAHLEQEEAWVSTLRRCFTAFEHAAWSMPFPSDCKSFSSCLQSALTAVASELWPVLSGRIPPEHLLLLEESARTDLENLLTERLMTVLHPSLDLEYRVASYTQASPLTSRLREIDGTGGHEYHLFLKVFFQVGFRRFFREHAFLARLTAVTVDQWVAAVSTFLSRLHADRDRLRQRLPTLPEELTVCGVRGGISDLHNGGSSVFVIRFRSGERIVYKPRDVGLEQAFGSLLCWLGDSGLRPRLRAPWVITRPLYGWVEYIAQEDCHNEEQIRAYFVRCGMLLFLSYVLQGTDIHHENVIAAGADPVIVDLETLLHPRYPRRSAPANDAPEVAGEWVWKSVLRTMMLPNWTADYDGHRFNLSGLSMGQGDASSTATDRGNTPTLFGKPISAESYRSEIEAGFRAAANFFLAHKEALCGSHSPLTAFSDKQVRFILRPTRLYGQIVRRFLLPDRLCDGTDASIEIDVLASTFLHSGNKPSDWPILRAEHRCLESLNIPCFRTSTSGTHLDIGDGAVLENYFDNDSYSDVIANVAGLNQAEVEEQIQFIRSSFHTFRAAPTYSVTVADARDLEGGNGEGLSPGALLGEAARIGDALLRTRVTASDGSSAWIGMTFLPKLERYEFQVIDHSLYAGNAGICLFLACLAKATRRAEYADGCYSGLQTIRERIRRDPARYARILGIGGFVGIPSIAYALCQSGLLLGDDSLVEDAICALSGITDDQIQQDTSFDIVLGTAGTILVLVGVHRIAAESRLLQLAATCGERLLTTLPRPSDPGKTSPWAAHPRTGFAHGCAGVALALTTLHRTLGGERYLAAAKDLIDHENSYWSEEAQNWLDGDGERVFYGKAWCHGPPGIALSRLRSMELWADSAARSDVDRALRLERSGRLSLVDNLCCGSAGRWLVLLEASRLLKDSGARMAARRLAASVVRKAHAQGGAYDLVAGLPHSVSNPSLMQGLAGVGYALLAALEESEIHMPRILSLEGPLCPPGVGSSA
jgi:type 2 lantibiotic biosynthesis protein LanM